MSLNEAVLNSTTSVNSICGSGRAPKFDPSQLKLYQLFIGLGSHEFRFQSLEDPDQKFFVNVDTVAVEFI